MNYRDINLIYFFDNSIICFIINIYSDKQHTALKYLKDIEINLNNILIIIDDFNIRNNNWDITYPYHSVQTDNLVRIVKNKLHLFYFINLFSILN